MTDENFRYYMAFGIATIIFLLCYLVEVVIATRPTLIVAERKPLVNGDYHIHDALRR